MLRVPHVTKHWGKHGVCNHSLKDWTTLDSDTRNAPNIVNFERSVLRSFLVSSFCCIFMVFFEIPCFN